MKRFSKFFCVALIAIVFSGLIDHDIVSKVFATTYPQCTDANNAIDHGTIPIASLSKDCVAGRVCPGYCYSKAAQYILDKNKTINKKKNGTPVVPDDTLIGGANSNSSVNENNLAILSSDQTPAGIVLYDNYLKFQENLPDNTNFDDTIKTLGLDLKTAPPLDKNVSDALNKVAENNGICDDFLQSSILIHPGWWFRELLQTINCWIIALISKVVSWGTSLMGLLIDPGFWGGISTNPAVKAGFSASVKMVNIIFSVVLVMMSIGTILNLKSYKIHELITKFIIVALLINFTVVIAGSIIDLANYLSLYFLNLIQQSTTGGLTAAWNGIFTGVTSRTAPVSTGGILLVMIFINLLLLIAICWAFGSILISLIKRGFMLIFLLIISPFAVIAYLLPNKGMGQWWEKWKQAFLKNTFYGVYVVAGLYLGTIMLQSLCQSFDTSILGTGDMSFMAGMMLPIMASGFLIYLVLLADELAGGSAKSAAEGATKVALGLAAGGAVAGAMQLKNAVTTSEGYGKTVSSLSTKKGLGWLGNAGLKVREDSLAYRGKQGETLDADVNRRDVDTNKARLKELDGSKDPKAAREMAAIAKQLYAKKQMDENSAKLLEKNADTIGSKENARNGWIPYTLKKTLKDLGPNLFTRTDLESDTGMTEGRIMDALAANGGDIEKTAIALTPQGLDDDQKEAQQKKIGNAIKKYFDARTKAGIQFAQNAANTSDKFVFQTIVDGNKAVQDKIMEGLAQTPATMKHVLEQIESSGLGNDEKRIVYDLFQTYMDKNGSRFNEKQLDWIDTNIGQINTDEARGRVSCPEVAQTEATAEDTRRTNDKINKMYSEATVEDTRRTNEKQKQIDEAFKDNAALITLDEEIKQAKLDMYTASTTEKSKKAEQHINELLKKRQDIISGHNHS